MSEKTWSRDTSGLVAHAKQRSEEKRQRVDETIDRLLREQQVINFNSVAKAAGVSKAYLYSQLDQRERIEALRQQQLVHVVREQSSRPVGKTDASRDLVVLAKDRRISIEDAQMRHGRKSRSVRVDGYKRHVLRDLDTGLIRAVGITPANVAEATVAEAIAADLRAQQASALRTAYRSGLSQ